MKRKKRKNQRWKLPVFPLYVRIILYLACVIAAAGTMAETVYDVLPPAAENGLYVCAAVLLGTGRDLCLLRPQSPGLEKPVGGGSTPNSLRQAGSTGITATGLW